ncbi:MAG TPA: hypothetical protein VJ508_00975, partial [Saprospiraceae bacterium]|nr:hypothetical protein [Saprospiraceae bacterium]
MNTTGSGTSEKIVTDSTGFVATGNFLNWLTSSKFDIEKKILTGGKFDTTNNVLIAESRGCAGRKFIKTVTGVNLSFGIHGGTPGGISSTQNQGTEYGQTYIEIYAGAYNTSDCLAAMNDWMTLTTNPVNLGTFQNDTKGCVGAGNSQYNAINIWNHNLHNCYQGITSGAQGYSTNLNALEVECQNAYGSGVLPNTITDPNSGISICSSVLTYEYPVGSGNFQTGYLGVCYNGTSFDQNCAVTQMQNFCLVNVTTNPVVDPSSTVLPGTAQSVPGFILEQGLMDTILVGQLTVKIAQSTAPAGLIQDFQSSIRMGALTFNNNGSGTECGSSGSVPCVKACSVTTTRMCYVTSDCPSGESCITLTKTDGGKIITYIGDPTGDHGTPDSLI